LSMVNLEVSSLLRILARKYDLRVPIALAHRIQVEVSQKTAV